MFLKCEKFAIIPSFRIPFEHSFFTSNPFRFIPRQQVCHTKSVKNSE